MLCWMFCSVFDILFDTCLCFQGVLVGSPPSVRHQVRPRAQRLGRARRARDPALPVAESARAHSYFFS